MATAEFYPNLKEIRCFRTDTRLEYEPPVDKIEKCFLEENEGKMVSVAICCTKCGCLLANERKRRILSLPTSDWESLHFGCSETKKMSDAHIKRARKARYDMILFCALYPSPLSYCNAEPLFLPFLYQPIVHKKHYLHAQMSPSF